MSINCLARQGWMPLESVACRFLLASGYVSPKGSSLERFLRYQKNKNKKYMYIDDGGTEDWNQTKLDKII